MIDKYIVLHIQSYLQKCSNCNICDLIDKNRYCYCCKNYFCKKCDMKWWYTLDEVMGKYCAKCYDLVYA